MGAELNCPHCRMNSWTALDMLKQRLVCEMCGREFDTTQQLVRGEWHYRRSGVLGAERNAQGAIPVVLTLQQFKVNLSGFREQCYAPSLTLSPKTGPDLPCEVDFVWMISEPYPEKTVIMIGECKDQGSSLEAGQRRGTIDATDIDNLRRVADAFPQKRFSTYIVLAKLCPFTEEEIALAKTLNERYRNRVILLTARELEPYHLYDRTKLEFKDIMTARNSNSRTLKTEVGQKTWPITLRLCTSTKPIAAKPRMNLSEFAWRSFVKTILFADKQEHATSNVI